MHKFGKYNAADRMAELVDDDHRALLVMSRFGIGLGFGEGTIGEVCAAAEVDTDTFLAVINLLVADVVPPADRVSLPSLLGYLERSHDYFVGFRLPAIRERLVAVVGQGSDLARAIVRYFDEYAEGVATHTQYEEKEVFPYVRGLLEGRRAEDFSIAVFGGRHDHVEERLNEFKSVFVKYYSSPATNEINGILFDVIACAQDLASHNEVENSIFIPAVEALEGAVSGAGSGYGAGSARSRKS